MLYTKEQLRRSGPRDEGVVIQRYIYKVLKSETSKLLPHECDYLALRFRSIFKENELGETELAVDPYLQPFLSEAVFKFLILIYHENLDFLQPVIKGDRQIDVTEIEIDRRKFEELLTLWRLRLTVGREDRILHEVRLEYHRKIGLLNKQYLSRSFGRFRYERLCLEQELNAFYIYFTVKSFFREIKAQYVESNVAGRRFVLNAYSYVHIISRHYIPKFNGLDPEKSFNQSLPFIDPFDLPADLGRLIADYFSNVPPGYVFQEENMIFGYKRAHYILWWKKKHIDEISAVGYEIRSLYKIEGNKDQPKLLNKAIIQAAEDLYYYY
jgi:hypothetical protein